MKSKIKGELGEETAVKYLQKQKYKIIQRNFKSVTGEIDIIALDKKTLVFVEVKTRTSGFFGLPREAVNEKKQYKIARTAQDFMRQHKVYSLKTRFDVVEVTPEKVNHIKDAFCTELL